MMCRVGVVLGSVKGRKMTGGVGVVLGIIGG